MVRKTSKKIDWEYLLSLPKFQRDFVMKKMAKKEKEENENKRPDSRLGSI